MDLELDADQKAIVDSLGTLLGRHAGPKRAIELERTGGYDHALHTALDEAGFFDIHETMGPLGAVLVIEQVAKAAGVVSIGANALVLPALELPAAPVTALSDENLRSPLRFAADAAQVLSIGESRVGRIELSAADATRVPSAFMYPLGKVEQRNLRLSPVSVSPAHARDMWRLSLAAECVGTMSGALSLTVEYVKNRRQFGRHIGSFQAVQHRLAQCAVQLEGARFLTYEAAHRGGREAIATAASYATQAARLVHSETHQLTGALGFTREHDLHVWSMRLCALRVELGGTTEHRRALAQERWGLSFMSGLVALEGDEQLLADALERFCAAERVSERAQHGQGRYDPALWKALCEQGSLELARPDAGSLRLVVVTVEVLGRHGLPGPLSDTILALGLVDDDDAAALLSGAGLASIAAPPDPARAAQERALRLVPEAERATLLLEIEQDAVFRLERRGKPVGCDGLGAESWAELPVARAARFESSAQALLVHDVALAAQLAALADELVRRTAEHAATRKQFGKPIAAFQAVSHPLASAHIALSAAAMLARAAACAADDGNASRARSLATAALISAERAALEAVYTCHQKLGALGITLEGPAHHVSRRVRSLSTRAAARSEATRELLLEAAGALS